MTDNKYGLLPVGVTRITDAARDKVIATLRTAHGDGRLPADLFDARVTGALEARTQDELNELTSDLGTKAPANDYDAALARVLATMPMRRAEYPTRMALAMLAFFCCWVPALACTHGTGWYFQHDAWSVLTWLGSFAMAVAVIITGEFWILDRNI